MPDPPRGKELVHRWPGRFLRLQAMKREGMSADIALSREPWLLAINSAFYEQAAIGLELFGLKPVIETHNRRGLPYDRSDLRRS